MQSAISSTLPEVVYLDSDADPGSHNTAAMTTKNDNINKTASLVGFSSYKDRCCKLGKPPK
jgi:hypothetical protein